MKTLKYLDIVRHGSSLTNGGEYWADGPATIPLTREGKRQAQEFADRWEQRPDLIVCSNFVRSIQTATPLARKFGLPLLPLKMLREFTYWDIKLTKEDHQRDRKAEADAYWGRLDVFEKKGGANAESFVEFIARVSEFRQRVEGEKTQFKNCVAVGHGHFMHAFRAIVKHGVCLPHRELMAHLHATLPGNAYANLQVERYLINSAHEGT